MIQFRFKSHTALETHEDLAEAKTDPSSEPWPARILAFVAVLQLAVVGPMNRGFRDLRSEMNGRFEGMDQRFDDLRAGMNGRFEAMDQRFDDLRAEMNGRFDGLRTEMNGRVDGLRAQMNQRFDQQDKYMNARFDATDERIGSSGQKKSPRFAAWSLASASASPETKGRSKSSANNSTPLTPRNPEPPFGLSLVR